MFRPRQGQRKSQRHRGSQKHLGVEREREREGRKEGRKEKESDTEKERGRDREASRQDLVDRQTDASFEQPQKHTSHDTWISLGLALKVRGCRRQKILEQCMLPGQPIQFSGRRDFVHDLVYVPFRQAMSTTQTSQQRVDCLKDLQPFELLFCFNTNHHIHRKVLPNNMEANLCWALEPGCGTLLFALIYLRSDLQQYEDLLQALRACSPWARSGKNLHRKRQTKLFKT